MSRKPIEHVPVGSDMRGANDPAVTPLHRVVATVEWSDGIVSEHRGLTRQWASTHVRVSFSVQNPIAARARDQFTIWLMRHQVRRNDDPPELGEIIPAPWLGIDATMAATNVEIHEWRTRHETEVRGRINPAY